MNGNFFKIMIEMADRTGGNVVFLFFHSRGDFFVT